MKTILLWDWPTRLFHWLLVLCVVGAFASILLADNLILWHARLGYGVIFLIAFRLVWGVLGSTYARFGHFFPTPLKIKNYLNGNWNGAGHNPLGAFSVFALLFLCALQAFSGLFTNDEIMFKGALSSLIDVDLSLWITSIHKQMAWVLMAFVALHVLAIVLYKIIKKDNLVIPMITGKKTLSDDFAQNYQAAPIWVWIVAILFSCLVLYLALGCWIPEPEISVPPPAPDW